MTVTCSAGRVALGEPVAGSAPFARVWVLVEQPGPWGRDALRESHLDAAVGESLALLGSERPVRVGLIRSVGAHADVVHGSPDGVGRPGRSLGVVARGASGG